MTRLPRLSVGALATLLALASCGPPKPSAPACKGYLPGDLVISEIMANPAGTDTGNEWFEIYNAKSTAANLAGVQLGVSKADKSGEKDFVIPSGSIPAGGYFVAGDADPKSLPTFENLSYGNNLGSLRNTDGRIAITCAAATIDEVTYSTMSSGTSWQLSGASAPDYKANDDPANWCNSTNEYTTGSFGTPGKANDVCAGGPSPTQCTDGGTARDIVAPQPGDLVIDEVMPNPDKVSDSNGEWFEVAVEKDVDLNGLRAGQRPRAPPRSPSPTPPASTPPPAAIWSSPTAPTPRSTAACPRSMGSSPTIRPDQLRRQRLHRPRRRGPRPGAVDELPHRGGALPGPLEDRPHRQRRPRSLVPGGRRLRRRRPGHPRRRQPRVPAGGPPGQLRRRGHRAPHRPAQGRRPDHHRVHGRPRPRSATPTASGSRSRPTPTWTSTGSSSATTPARSPSRTPSRGPKCIHVTKGSYLVFAHDTDTTTNGGIPRVDEPFSFGLVNSTGGLFLAEGGQLLDSVTWKSTTTGASTQLDPGGAKWCPGTTAYGDGDLGTPGAVNLACP